MPAAWSSQAPPFQPEVEELPSSYAGANIPRSHRLRAVELPPSQPGTAELPPFQPGDAEFISSQRQRSRRAPYLHHIMDVSSSLRLSLHSPNFLGLGQEPPSSISQSLKPRAPSNLQIREPRLATWSCEVPTLTPRGLQPPSSLHPSCEPTSSLSFSLESPTSPSLSQESSSSFCPSQEPPSFLRPNPVSFCHNLKPPSQFLSVTA